MKHLKTSRPYRHLSDGDLFYDAAQARKMDDASQGDALLAELHLRAFPPRKAEFIRDHPLLRNLFPGL